MATCCRPSVRSGTGSSRTRSRTRSAATRRSRSPDRRAAMSVPGGCGCLSTVRLSGYPVREVSEVKIDGDVVDPSEYRLDGWQDLVRMDDPGPPVRKRRWPHSQNLALDDDQPNTFSVTYSHGV